MITLESFIKLPKFAYLRWVSMNSDDLITVGKKALFQNAIGSESVCFIRISGALKRASVYEERKNVSSTVPILLSSIPELVNALVGRMAF